MKIYPIGIPPNSTSIPLSFYKNFLGYNGICSDDGGESSGHLNINNLTNENRVFATNKQKKSSENGLTVVPFGIDGNYINFSSDIKQLSYFYFDHLYRNFKKAFQFGTENFWSTFSAEKNYLHQDEFDRKVYYESHPWILKDMKKRQKDIHRLIPLNKLEETILNSDDPLNNPLFYKRYCYSSSTNCLSEDEFRWFELTNDDVAARTEVNELLFLKYLCYLTKTFYSDFTFSSAEPISRNFYYFEFIDKNIRKYHESKGESIVNFNDNFYFRTRYLYTNKSVILPVIYYKQHLTISTLTLRQDVLRIPKNTKFTYLNYNEKYKLVLGFIIPKESSSTELPYFFYIPWKYVSAKFLKYEDDLWSYPEYSFQSIKKNKRPNKPKKISIPFDSLELRHSHFYSGVYQIDGGRITGISKKEIFDVIKEADLPIRIDDFKDSFENAKKYIQPKSDIVSGSFGVLSRLRNGYTYQITEETIYTRLPYSMAVDLLYDFKTIQPKKNMKKFIRKYRHHKRTFEWLKLCRYLDKSKDLTKLQEIASKKYGLTEDESGEMTKRELCHYISTKTSEQLKESIGKVISLWDERQKKYGIPKKICLNIEQIEDDSEVKNNFQFYTVVLLDLGESYCMDFDTLEFMRRQDMCRWNLREGREPDIDGWNFKPDKSYKIYPLHYTPHSVPMATSSGTAVTQKSFDLMRQKTEFAQKRKKIAVFFLGKPKEEDDRTCRIGNCQGSRGVSQTHAQLHSTKSIYEVEYVRIIDPKIYLSSDESENLEGSRAEEDYEVQQDEDE